ncbi:MAG: NAD+ synthase [Geminicoccaceae bacterium]|nr:NAD+ synthase [Geminicoccaceae bacterium]MCX8101485.1 NAD+ synthase [Geminicoccaceae bacterium]MDW8370686.1 NAD+ synthase [Geminicoccaceae bacterium]
MSEPLTIALAQVDPTVGDLDGNLALLRAARAEAAAAGADLVLFPELAIVGYPPEDLVLKQALADHARHALDALARDTADGGPAVVVGTPWRERDRLFNAVALLAGGRIEGWRAKHALPNYGVFDEKRVFEAGPVPGPVPFRRRDGSLVRLGLMICEDMWVEDVAEALAESGAELLLVINGSPFERDKPDVRLQLAIRRITETGLPLLYVNQVGGQDELVFDGASFALDGACGLIGQARAFAPDLLVTRWLLEGERWVPAEKGRIEPPLERLEAIWRAMMLGLHDYVEKNRFPGVVLGLSGGIDSAVSAAVAVDALGPHRVRAVMMPSRYTSRESLEDAAEVARRLAIRYDVVGIEPAVAAFSEMLAPLFEGRSPDTTEENIQSRIRGVILMAISNKLGPMVLTTGNKSEMSVGYATLYGDMCGGYSVLKDVYKTTVFELARWRNAHRPSGLLGPENPIPERVLVKAPSAELRANQKDEDSLPPYPLLDRILEGLVEEDLSPRELVERGLPAEVVRRVSAMLDAAEYKRRQAPPGVKITRKAFGRDRRYPITNAFRRLGLAPLPEPAPVAEAAAPVHSQKLATLE